MTASHGRMPVSHCSWVMAATSPATADNNGSTQAQGTGLIGSVRGLRTAEAQPLYRSQSLVKIRRRQFLAHGPAYKPFDPVAAMVHDIAAESLFVDHVLPNGLERRWAKFTERLSAIKLTNRSHANFISSSSGVVLPCLDVVAFGKLEVGQQGFVDRHGLT